MNVSFKPVSLEGVAAVFERLWPRKRVTVEFVTGLHDQTKAYGRTGFRRGCVPKIVIDAKIPFYGVVDVLVHELAHVAAGAKAGHGKKWKGAYDLLCRELKK